jgi:hypothetical protein
MSAVTLVSTIGSTNALWIVGETADSQLRAGVDRLLTRSWSVATNSARASGPVVVAGPSGRRCGAWRPVDHCLLELVRDAVDDDEALGVDASLTGVGEPRLVPDRGAWMSASSRTMNGSDPPAP